ncbi:hypothetical protein [Streptomyces noursei]|uniref:hypothetical protein n=1 Tax=Streptomyces noursei TaxID=1971 RepID=UPI001CA5CD8D|nr:hypothetical protein [Streptomyces noursei]
MSKSRRPPFMLIHVPPAGVEDAAGRLPVPVSGLPWATAWVTTTAAAPVNTAAADAYTY